MTMVSMVHARSRRLLALAVSALALGACEQGGSTPRGASLVGATAAATVDAPEPGPTCGGTGSHDTHTVSIGCAVCHPCGGTHGIATVTLPRGTSTAGGTMGVDAAGNRTCTVACHSPFGGTPQPVAWNSGPIACTGCHTGAVPRTGAQASQHVRRSTDPVQERADCGNCHVLTAHLSGTVRIADGSGAVIDVTPANLGQLNGACQACHDGNGATLGGDTAPLLVGWASTTGDFHGARAGTGWGGTLAAPYVRGQGPLACTACHDAHASENAFLLKVTPLQVRAIDRAGVGAEGLCMSCHLGERHAGCLACHAADPVPAGNGCFLCHGHEGIRNFPAPTQPHPRPPYSGGDCSHCHSDTSWLPALDTTPPTITVAANAAAVGFTSVTVQWTTSEAATSYVEWGVGALGNVSGNDVLATSHSVTLTGLAGATTYGFRVRSSDAFRNVVISPTATFATMSPDAPTAPGILDTGDAWTPDVADMTLRWTASTDPQNDAIQYQVEIDTSPAFSAPIFTSAWQSGTTLVRTMEASYLRYYWRVRARDPAGNLSPASAYDSFVIWPDYGY